MPGPDDGCYGQPNFVCPRCGAVSVEPMDVEHGYCGRCHDWTGDDFEHGPPTPPNQSTHQQT